MEMEKTVSFFDENGMKKGAWSEEEDDKLRTYIHRYGHWNWGLLPKFAGLCRSGKSCRLRWMNYLRPDIKHGNFTKEEDDIIVDLQKKLGNRWSAMTAKLPGRSDNEIKNRWNTQLKKRGKTPHVCVSEDGSKTKGNPGEMVSFGETWSSEASFGGDFWTDTMLSNSTDEYISTSISSCQDEDATMSDEFPFPWSTLDPYFQYNNDFVNWSF